MVRRFRLPMFVVAAALLGLLALLAMLQYRWLGTISDAEREQMKATLNTRASDFAKDFDRELTRAHLLFQLEPVQEETSIAGRLGARYDRWQSTARYPRMIQDVFVVATDANDKPALQRFNPSTRFVEPAEWPASFSELRAQVDVQKTVTSDNRAVWVRTMLATVWENIPAVVVPAPHVIFNQHGGRTDLKVIPRVSYTVLLLNRDYLVNDVLPALAQQHFRGGDDVDYQLAVVSPAAGGVLYRSTRQFEPKPDAQADASADLFQIRVQEFGNVAAEVRQFTTLLTMSPQAQGRGAAPGTVRERVTLPLTPDHLAFKEGSPVSIFVQGATPAQKSQIAAGTAAASRLASLSQPRWRLLVKHPAGSLEGAVAVTRRRNLLVSSSILGLLGASMGLLVLSTRRAQRLAQQQMEFVAAVSHELRTPLAVIRAAADNLAEGVVDDGTQIRKYGALVRSEGRRLSEMVEQILELSGIQSGQRSLTPSPVGIEPVLRDVVAASSALIEAAGIEVEFDMPADLPPVMGDEPALRRVFQNLVGNAIKYGASGRWIGVRARMVGADVHIAIADRGIGIESADQSRIFEPFYRAASVVAAQIQGAGLGLSLVQRIVDAHGGKVTVESAPGNGSTFTVVLRAAPEVPVGDRQALHGDRLRAQGSGL
jgi:two-component system, OmpR family, sensor histidine kinase SenX3